MLQTLSVGCQASTTFRFTVGSQNMLESCAEQACSTWQPATAAGGPVATRQKQLSTAERPSHPSSVACDLSSTGPGACPLGGRGDSGAELGASVEGPVLQEGICLSCKSVIYMRTPLSRQHPGETPGQNMQD